MKDCLAIRPHRKKPDNRIDIPWLKQTDDYSCGVVAGWVAVKALYPARRNRQVFRKDCNPSKRYGTSIAKLVKALRTHHVRVSIKKDKLSFRLIKECVDNGLPIIACIKTGEPWLHWVTVYAYKTEGSKRVYLCNNGWADVNGEISYREFEKLLVGSYLVCAKK